MEFKREQLRFPAGGIKTNAPADALPDGKYAYLQNTRAFTDSVLGSRPQFVQVIAPPGAPGPVLALEPSMGVYKIGDSLYVNAAAVDNGYLTSAGISLVPFRPNASPDAYEYAFDSFKSSKIKVPSIGPPVVKKTGVVEPQAPIDAAVNNQFNSFINMAGAWVAGGTGAVVGTMQRVVDTVGVVFTDPASVGNRTSFQVSPAQQYSRGMVLEIHGQEYIVDDVIPNLSTPIEIDSIRYFAGTTGRCVVVPANMANEDPSLWDQLYLSLIRRGAIISIGAELCYVLNSSVGPDGTICFETSTTINHTAAEQIVIADTVIVIGSGVNPGDAIRSLALNVNANVGIATYTQALAVNPFVSGTQSFQPDDYIHISIKHGNLVSVAEMKILFDVGDGSFTKDFYFYTIRPSDLRDAVNNTQTQLAAAQIALQRAVIDQEKIALSRDQGRTASSAQIGPGDLQWSEIFFRISDLTRVGDNGNRTLQNVNRIQILINVVGSPINPATAFNSITITGGFQPDIAFTGVPYQYWLKPRDSSTGATGNPCPGMRYTASPRRQSVYVPLPTTYPDPQVDTLDIYRMGGSVDVPRYIGSVKLGATHFTDNYSDATALAGRVMSRDDLEPFPSVAYPLLPTVATIVGTTMVVQFPTVQVLPNGKLTADVVAALLPGNLVNVGQQVFTLWTRPTLISTVGPNDNWLFQFVENAGTQTNPLVQVQQPLIANQMNPCVWGPDSNGVFFAVRDPFRPGVVNHTNPNNPDSASDKYSDDLCPPTEPLQNGCLLNQTSVVFSTKRAWAGYPRQGGSGYRWVEIPVGDGLAAEFAICTDGKAIYYVGNHGIMRTVGGMAHSLTDADLYNLFPHEGVFPKSIVTPAGTIFPPDYTKKSKFRLAVVNEYLYFDYQDASSTQRTLVCDLRTVGWSIESAATPVTIHAGSTLEGNLQKLFLGNNQGAILNEQSNPTPNTGENVAVSIYTRELMNDLRASAMFGDASLDCLPLSAITATPVFLGVLFGTASTAAAGAARITEVIDLLGQQIKRSLGLMIQWTDRGVTSFIYGWGASIVPQPEDTQDRFSDWEDLGVRGAKFIQGFILEADTFNVDKQFSVRSADDAQVKQTFTVRHDGQQAKAYSFDTAFAAHLIRLEPDQVPWRQFGLRWVFEPTPEIVTTWEAQETSHGLPGYQHVKELLIAYKSPGGPVTFRITIDGTNFDYTLPLSAGFRKVLIECQAVKGLVFKYRAFATTAFQIWVNDIEVKVKAWGDPGPYLNWQQMGAPMGPAARI